MLTLVGKALERRSFVAKNADLRRKLAELERRGRRTVSAGDGDDSVA
jgi:hypothetical protein